MSNSWLLYSMESTIKALNYADQFFLDIHMYVRGVYRAS